MSSIPRLVSMQLGSRGLGSAESCRGLLDIFPSRLPMPRFPRAISASFHRRRFLHPGAAFGPANAPLRCLGPMSIVFPVLLATRLAASHIVRHLPVDCRRGSRVRHRLLSSQVLLGLGLHRAMPAIKMFLPWLRLFLSICGPNLCHRLGGCWVMSELAFLVQDLLVFDRLIWVPAFPSSPSATLNLFSVSCLLRYIDWIACFS